MLTSTHRLIHEFNLLVQEEYNRLRNNLASGSAQTFDEYQKQVGRIQGLATALEFIEDAKAIADGEKTRGE